MALFQSKVEQKYLSAVNADIDSLYTLYEATFQDPERQATIRQTIEEEYQGKFLIDLFVNLLGYTLKPDNNFNLVREQKNETDAKKADGAIVVDGKTVGVIELKDHKTQDLKKVEVQAFGYKNNHKECRYLVTSNFERLRFYIDNAVDFSEFDLFSLDKEGFKRLWLCLSYESISQGIPAKIKGESVSTEDQSQNNYTGIIQRLSVPCLPTSWSVIRNSINWNFSRKLKNCSTDFCLYSLPRIRDCYLLILWCVLSTSGTNATKIR